VVSDKYKTMAQARNIQHGDEGVEEVSEAVVNSSSSVGLDLVWGVRQIAKIIDRPERAAFYLLEKNKIPCAKKIGGRWCSSRSRLQKFFDEQLAGVLE
jgi:hypothetical protein